MAARRNVVPLLISLILVNGLQTIIARNHPLSTSQRAVACDDLFSRTNSGIVHISGRLDPRLLNPAVDDRDHASYNPTDRQHVPLVMVSTIAPENSETECQEAVKVDSRGSFQTDVAVNKSSWSVHVTACEPDNGTGNGRVCLSTTVKPPGQYSSDICHPVTTRALPPIPGKPGVSHYLARIDFRRCTKRHGGSAKSGLVNVRRTRLRRNAEAGERGEQLKRMDGDDERRLDELVQRSEAKSNTRPTGGRRIDQRREGSEGSPRWHQRVVRKPIFTYQAPVGTEWEAKRRWEKTGMAWIKKDESEQPWRHSDYEDSNSGGSKRRWEKSGMSWMKKNLPNDEKRRWEKSGMSWMKRPAYNDNYDVDNDNNYNADEMENMERRWEKPLKHWK